MFDSFKHIQWFIYLFLLLLQAVIGSAPNSPERNGQCADRVNGVNGHSALPMVPADMPKKRRAPRPPMTASQSVACGHHTRDFSDPSESDSARKQVGLLWASPFQSKQTCTLGHQIFILACISIVLVLFVYNYSIYWYFELAFIPLLKHHGHFISAFRGSRGCILYTIPQRPFISQQSIILQISMYTPKVCMNKNSDHSAG